mgnify:CR=1 FL=1
MKGGFLLASVVDNIQDVNPVVKLDQLFLAAIDHPTTKDWIKNATKDFDFREGRQWTPDELKELKKRGQPDIVENEIFYKVNAIKGRYKKQKTKIVFRGRNVAQDEPIANDLSDLTLHILQRSGYEFEEDPCFDDGIVSGVGWLEPYVEFDEAFEPEIKVRYVDCLSIYVDPYAHKSDLSDAHYICLAKWVHVSEATTMYPDKAIEINGYFQQTGLGGQLSGVDKLRGDNYIDYKNSRVRLVEVRYKDQTKKKILVYSDQQQGSQVIDVSTKSDAQIKKMQKQYPDAKLVEKAIDNIKVGVYCGDILLEDIKDMPHEYKSFFLIPYYVYRKKNGEPYGIVRQLIDPQTEVNKRRSKALHLLMTNQTIYEINSIEDKDEYRVQSAMPDGMMEVRNKDKVEILKNIEVADTQMRLHDQSLGAIDRIVGVPTEPIASEQIRSGVGMARKQAAVDMPIAPIFENLRRTRLLLGKHLYELIKQYYTAEKVFYVLDDAQKAKQFSWTQEHMRSIKEGIYDVIIEEMPDTTTLQDEQFQMVTQLLQSFNLPPQLAMAMFPMVIQLSQLRDKQNILKKFEEQMQPSPILPKMSLNINWDTLFPEEKAVFADMFGRKDLSQQEMQIQHDPAQIVKAKEGIQKVQMKAQVDMQKNQPNPQADQQQMVMEQQKHGMEMQQNQEKHQMDMQEKQQTHDQKMQQNEDTQKMALMSKAMQTSKMMREPDPKKETK